jgi:glycosyltransferase involved in cell wall biosynthesis
MERLRKTGRAEKMLIHNGIDLDGIPKNPDRMALRRELRIAKGVPLIGAVGRLVPVKNLPALLTAALILGGKDKRMQVVIVGDGPERMELQKKRDALGLTKRVVFLGHRHDIHQVIAGLDVLAMPSLHEGLPMTLLEAMALGVPVVAGRVGGIVEALGEMAEDCTVPPNDPASLADKIWELLSSSALREECAGSGIRRVREAFTAEKMAEDYAKLLFKAATQ